MSLTKYISVPGNNFVEKIFQCFPITTIVSCSEWFSPKIHIHFVIPACFKNLKSHFSLNTNHQTADNLNIWLHISSVMTTVLNCTGILLC